jgi:hypothetical protein
MKNYLDTDEDAGNWKKFKNNSQILRIAKRWCDTQK